MHMMEIHTANFAWCICSFRRPFLSLMAYHMGKGGNPLHDTLGLNCKGAFAKYRVKVVYVGYMSA